MIARIAFSALIAATLAGCGTLGPDTPEARIEPPDDWVVPLERGLSSDPADLAVWWDKLEDPRLTDLVLRALIGNLDLRLSMERVLEARSQRGVERQNLFPVVDGNGTATFIEFSDNDGQAFGLSDIEAYNVGVSANWELDFWGRVRNAVEAAEGELSARIEDVHGAMVLIATETAIAYIDLVEGDEQIAVAQRNLELQRTSLRLSQARYDAGLVDELDVAQARTLVGRTQSQIPSLQAARFEALTRIAVLLGTTPNAVAAELEQPGSIPEPPAALQIGLPADALRRRPDLRAAENRLAAQAARVGVAQAELYPRFALFGNVALTANDFGDLLQTDSLGTQWGPRVSLPLFRGGALRARVGVEESLLEQALLGYEQTVLTALAESSAALQAYGRGFERREALSFAVDAAGQAVAKSQALYTEGLVDFQTVVDSQRELVGVEAEWIASRAAIARLMVSVVRTVGGGWEPPYADDLAAELAEVEL